MNMAELFLCGISYFKTTKFLFTVCKRLKRFGSHLHQVCQQVTKQEKRIAQYTMLDYTPVLFFFLQNVLIMRTRNLCKTSLCPCLPLLFFWFASPALHTAMPFFFPAAGPVHFFVLPFSETVTLFYCFSSGSIIMPGFRDLIRANNLAWNLKVQLQV